MHKLQALKQYFGFSSFRDGQENLIDSILEGHDVLGIMPTGAGKSICFQLPALMFQGITLVVSPLISLMKDQVHSLTQSGIKAAYLNSSLSKGQYQKALRNAINSEYKLIYIAPERLFTYEIMQFAKGANISMVTIDEAHCISQWGQDFRPSYLKIYDFTHELPQRPIISAFTATATRQVRDDIIEKLNLKNPFVLTTGFNRENLFFSVKKPRNKLSSLKEYIADNAEKTGIIYCLTRKTTEDVCRELAVEGYSVTRFHAGLTNEEKNRNQDLFVRDERTIMVATNAFGMGIDKSNISYVIHYNMPGSIESYYQEAGRAGRDGTPADCILLYGQKDVQTNKFLIEKAGYKETAQENIQRNLELLNKIIFYCKSAKCLRSYILNYFGEGAASFCGNCSYCKKFMQKRKIQHISDMELFQKLKLLRAMFAASQKVPAYVIFSDATLKDMCDKLPTNSTEFLRISGVGDNKLEKYGDPFIKVVKDHVNQM